MARDVGSAQVNCPDSSIGVFLRCLDGWSFTEQVHVRLNGDKTGTEETKRSTRFPNLLKGSYKIELTLKGDDIFCKDQEVLLTSNSESLKKVSVERNDGDEEATLKVDVPIDKDPDEISLLIHFEPPYHAVSSVVFADPEAPDSQTPSYDTPNDIQYADEEEKRAFSSESEDLKIVWEMEDDGKQLKAEFVKRALVTIIDRYNEVIWFDYIDGEATKSGKGELEWKGEINVKSKKSEYPGGLVPSSLSPFHLKMEVKEGVGIRERAMTWSYLERACILKLLLYRGQMARSPRFNMSVFDTEDNLKSNSPIWEAKRLSNDRVLLADIPAKFAFKTGLVVVRFLDEQNRETGEGLILKIEDPGKISKPSVASRLFQALGYYKDSTLLTEESLADLSEQKYLDFYSVWGDYNRVREETISGLEKYKVKASKFRAKLKSRKRLLLNKAVKNGKLTKAQKDMVIEKMNKRCGSSKGHGAMHGYGCCI